MKHIPTWRRTAAAAVLPLALTGLGACGGDTESAEESSASAQLEQEGGEEVDDLEAGDEVPTDEFVAMMSDFVDEATTARTTMSLDSAGARMSGDGVVDYASEPASMRMSMEADVFGDEPLEMVLVDNVMYMKMPQTGDKYVSFDLDDPDSPFGTMMADSMDPSKQLEVLQEGIEGVTFAGEEDVDGESMERYSAVVDPGAVLEGMQGTEGQQDVPESMMPQELAYDLWFDDEGRMRRMTSDMGALGSIEMTLDDWGTEVDIQAPPADQVTTMEDMMGSMSSMS